MHAAEAPGGCRDADDACAWRDAPACKADSTDRGSAYACACRPFPGSNKPVGQHGGVALADDTDGGALPVAGNRDDVSPADNTGSCEGAWYPPLRTASSPPIEA